MIAVVKMILKVFLAVGIMFFIPGHAAADDECSFCRLASECCRELIPSDPTARGQNVERLQIILKDVKCYDGPVNGVYDPYTVAAVKKFQAEQGFKTDGVVNEATWVALDKEHSIATGSKETEAPSGEVSILIDTVQRKLTILSNGEPFKQYPVAVGKHETPTPLGNFKVLRRARNWGTGFGTRWIGLTVPWGIYGIHGTNKPDSIGSFASHGCIRMNNHNVEEIYPWVKAGDRVVIVGNPYRYQPGQFRVMRRDARGGDVTEVQLRLQRLGFYDGPIDGIWGGGMERAVVKFREKKGLRYDNCVDAEVYRLLGL